MLGRPSDGVVLYGPRAVPFDLDASGFGVDHLSLLETAQRLELRVGLEVPHAIKPLQIRASLTRYRPSDVSPPATARTEQEA